MLMTRRSALAQLLTRSGFRALHLLSILTTLFFKASHPWLEVLLIAIVAIVVSAGLLSVVLLDYPFSGSISVSDSPFLTGVLAHLLAAHHG